MSLSNAILGILSYSPMTGYHLGKIFDESINYSWTASLSQIYRELGALEKQGYVSSSIEQQEDRPDKKIYTLTPEGRKAFEKWLTEFPESFSSPKRDGFMLRLFFGSTIEDTQLITELERFIAEKETFKKMMSDSKTMLLKMNKIMTPEAAESFLQKNKLCLHFIVKRALMTNQVLIDWAQECIDELKESKHIGGQNDEK